MWEDLWDFLKTAHDVSEKAMFHMAFSDLVASERTEAMFQLEQGVRSLQPGQFDAFEEVFLEHSLLFFDPEMRTRAMELYAWIKILEYQLAGNEFRGFLGGGGVIE